MRQEFRKYIITSTILVVLSGIFNPLDANDKSNRQPNVILIMADDLGRECLQCYGGQSYATPELDSIARQGAIFNYCYSTPICTTSRVQIMTGKYNHRNYDCFGYLNPQEKTFGNLFKDAGYTTMVAGKWQLNGYNDRPPRKNSQDLFRPRDFGFDQWHLWQMNQKKRERYWGANLVINGELKRMPDDLYSPDYFADCICGFMETNKDQPFFIYFPMLLTHDPFIRTPASEEKQLTRPQAFADMVNYTDRVVGKIDKKLSQLKISEDTLLIFTGDNGTSRNIVSQLKGQPLRGGKAKAINSGIHVPLICKWPRKIRPGTKIDHVVDFTDFVPSFRQVAGKKVNIESDGQSFLPLLGLGDGEARRWALGHYDCRWGRFPARQYAVDQQHKVYRDGQIFNISKDPLEEKPLSISALDQNQAAKIKAMRIDLERLPEFRSCSLVPGPRKDHPPEKPNIILMMADDLGWGDVGFNGNKTIRTPALDAMASAGLKFERFYAQSAVCSPTRGSCLTGRHPFRYGITGANVGHLNVKELTLAEFLKEKGYRTGHFGKWHLGTLDRNFSWKGPNRNPARNFMPPSAAGFDHWFSTEYAVATWDPYDPANAHARKHAGDPRVLYWQDGNNVTEPQQGDDSRIIMDRVLPFVQQSKNDNQPFCAIVWFHAPHKPVVTGEAYRAMYAKHPEPAQHYYGCITAMDEQIGRLRKFLQQNQLAKNTILCFCSDNGPEGKTVGKGTNWGTTAGLRGRKRSLYEGGIRVPAAIEWPSRIKAGTVAKKPFVTSDYFPTIVEILDGDPELIRGCDGISMVRLFDGFDQRHRGIGFRDRKTWVWMTERNKLIIKENGSVEMYNLVKDPGESNNLAEKSKPLTQLLKSELQTWQRSFE